MMPSGSFEEEHRSILLNIESTVINRYITQPEMVDHNVDKVYETLMREYQAALKDKAPPKQRFNEIEQTLYDELRPILEIEMRHGYDTETIIAVLKRLRTSIRLWGKGKGSYGRQGYLNYVRNFLDM
jgi:hypothetical protein